MASSTRNHRCLLFCLVTTIMITSSYGQESEPTLLFKFKSSLENATSSSSLGNWNSSVPLCTGNNSNWNGLLCFNGKFYGLRLESMGLSGNLDVDTLSQLTNLLTISIMNNNFEGPFPNVKKIGGRLRGLFLSNNRFSGELPDDAFAGMKSIRRILMANNEFTGKIPTSLLGIPKLVELQIQNNKFNGTIPAFSQKDFQINAANNRLEGPIPSQLSSQSASSFAGNLEICGKPMAACATSKKKKKIPIVAIILASIGGLIILAIILFALFLVYKQRKKPTQYEKSSVKNLNKKPSVLREEKYTKSHHDKASKLYFVRRDREKFDLEDLLRAPAEVLGSGSFGSSYKADLPIGKPIVVRRFRQMSNMGKEDFHEHMRSLGKLSHPNVLPLVAFYYRREEKLLVTDFVDNGSLASHLHGKRSPNQPSLDWPSRLKIIKGVTRGLAYLYKELPTLTLPHGHLKSSNVLLDHKFEPLVADYALVPVINKDHAKQFMVAYKSPEYMQNERLTRKTDVWSLGILILELLTGRFPANYLKQGKGANADLAMWVNSVVREEWTGEVFDKDMNTTKHNCEGEMLKLLKIGMSCCEMDVGKRCDLMEALHKIEELKENDEEDYSSNSYNNYASDQGEMYSSKAITDDDFSFSKNA
ncbi:pollen receptor-like kinase 4 [Solanum tuberosum]|nr:PREDICTED: pollen receptor-like kinase 4 [Solanum tuberosum]KAH0648299.1 hypothetical protein KY285_033547 [Solanum tuberosum]